MADQTQLKKIEHLVNIGMAHSAELHQLIVIEKNKHAHVVLNPLSSAKDLGDSHCNLNSLLALEKFLITLYNLLKRFRIKLFKEIEIDKNLKHHIGNLDALAEHYLPVAGRRIYLSSSSHHDFSKAEDELIKLEAEFAQSKEQQKQDMLRILWLYNAFANLSLNDGKVKNWIISEFTHTVRHNSLDKDSTIKFQELMIALYGVVRLILVELNRNNELSQNIDSDLNTVFAELKKPITHKEGRTVETIEAIKSRLDAALKKVA